MNENNDISTIISEKLELLDKLIGKKVVRMIRYSWWDKNESAIECEIKNNSVFSLTTGPLTIEFDSNIILGFNSTVELSSVVMWAESINTNNNGDLLSNDEELFPIEASDTEFSTQYFANIIDKTLLKYEIIKRETDNPLQWDHPREAALVLFFSNGSELVLGHQLSKDVSDDFTVLQWSQVDQDDVYPELYKMSKYW